MDRIIAKPWSAVSLSKTAAVHTGICRLWKCRRRSLDNFRNLSHSTEDKCLDSADVFLAYEHKSVKGVDV